MVGEGVSSFCLSSSSSSSPVRTKVPPGLEQAGEKRGEGHGGSYLVSSREGYGCVGRRLPITRAHPSAPLSRVAPVLQLIPTFFP